MATPPSSTDATDNTSEEGRVLGCLVEKQLTTPQQYPLTEKALMAACNQRSNRDPLVSYDVSTVRRTARGLREKGLLRLVHRIGERSDKHQHRLEQSLELSPGELTLLAVLLLRGPQTPGELRAHSERMNPFETHAQVQEALDTLRHREDPLVVRLERQPGHKEARYGQLLADVRNARATSPSDAAPLLTRLSQDSGGQDSTSVDRTSCGSTSDDSTSLAGLAREVALLRTEVDELRTQLDRLRDVNRGR